MGFEAGSVRGAGRFKAQPGVSPQTLLTLLSFPFVSQAARPRSCPAGRKGPTKITKKKSFQNRSEISSLSGSPEPSMAAGFMGHPEGEAASGRRGILGRKGVGGRSPLPAPWEGASPDEVYPKPLARQVAQSQRPGHLSIPRALRPPSASPGEATSHFPMLRAQSFPPGEPQPRHVPHALSALPGGPNVDFLRGL